ncbi:MAG: nucleotide exchange factor GrpE [Gammaproteobacteria bacterium TMED119]|nr:MAG: nucleotide exchange factor GrpE [Gammaproteobacteria bacterium TMED119]RCL45731.1 MAG: nucleotide exchange factor GrpE [Candidatus Thioglobus sp.]|tara:strand:- start:3100 stop:3684 length:585 start_codon:yes stop_codon:yes gene_type:complete
MSNTPDTPSDVDNDQQDNIELDLQPVPDDSEIKAQADQQAVAELEQALQEANDRADANGDMHMRSLAELENVKRRAQKDIEQAHKFALEKFSIDLLAVKDSLELGLSVEDADVEKIREGTELTLKMLTQVLDKFNIVELDPVGETFDPNQHQAMTMQPSSEHPPNTVISVMQKGYQLNDRLLRPAMVIVSKADD